MRNEDQITAGFWGGFLGLVTVVLETLRNRFLKHSGFPKIYPNPFLKYICGSQVLLKQPNTRAHKITHYTSGCWKVIRNGNS
jgi:hypothetical protein